MRKARDSCRRTGQRRPRRRFSAEEASRTACGKRSAWSTNQQPNLTQQKKKRNFTLVKFLRKRNFTVGEVS
ncbi:hypothetical protein E2R56_15700 [Rhodococcus qingshengii]|nr:hypothetical protein E2R56_15700 [Rhodococcus qingshengii]